MKTYEFSLARANVTKQQFIREDSLDKAVSQLEPDLEDGWSIQSVKEDGTLIPLPA